MIDLHECGCQTEISVSRSRSRGYRRSGQGIGSENVWEVPSSKKEETEKHEKEVCQDMKNESASFKTRLASNFQLPSSTSGVFNLLFNFMGVKLNLWSL